MGKNQSREGIQGDGFDQGQDDLAQPQDMLNNQGQMPAGRQSSRYQLGGMVLQPKKVKCCICFEDAIESQQFYKCQGCKTKQCNDCAMEWFATNIGNQIHAQSVQHVCPGKHIEKCQAIYTSDNILQMINSCINKNKSNTVETLRSAQQKFSDATLKRYLIKSKDIRMCPKENCDYGGVIDAREGACTEDLECRKCKNTWRDPLHISQLEGLQRNFENVVSFNGDSLNNLNKLLRTEPCPNCGYYIYKTGGCRKMDCPMCKHSFCWECLGEYYNYTHSRMDNGKYCGQRIFVFLILHAFLLVTLLFKLTGDFGSLISSTAQSLNSAAEESSKNRRNYKRNKQLQQEQQVVQEQVIPVQNLEQTVEEDISYALMLGSWILWAFGQLIAMFIANILYKLCCQLAKESVGQRMGQNFDQTLNGLFRQGNNNIVGNIIIAIFIFPFIAVIYVVVAAIQGLAIVLFMGLGLFLVLGWFSFGRTILFHFILILIYSLVKEYLEKHQPQRGRFNPARQF